MEDNNAISEQPIAVNYEEEYNKLAAEYNKLKKIVEQIYNRAKQLENTWMLTRAEFLFKIVDNNKFDVDTRQKAQKELENFLFPEKEEVNNEEK